jgi:5-methylcytosine-specific restriction endonuclease McrA
MAADIIESAEARARGLRYYFTGRPCKHGHIAERITANWTCVVCYDATLAQWRSENADRVREVDRLHRARTAEQHRANDLRWRWANIEAVRERDRARYIRADRDMLRKHRRDRKARLRNAEGSHTLAEIKDLLEKQKFHCAACRVDISRSDSRHLDHIMPVAKGGSNSIENLQWLCPACNRRKGARDPAEWAKLNGRLI